jgi:hypothetical protein
VSGCGCEGGSVVNKTSRLFLSGCVEGSAGVVAGGNGILVGVFWGSGSSVAVTVGVLDFFCVGSLTFEGSLTCRVFSLPMVILNSSFKSLAFGKHCWLSPAVQPTILIKGLISVYPAFITEGRTRSACWGIVNFISLLSFKN